MGESDKYKNEYINTHCYDDCIHIYNPKKRTDAIEAHMKNLKNDEIAENPMEVGFYVLMVLLVMAFLMTVVGVILDTFNVEMSALSLSSAWAQGVMATYLGYIKWSYRIPIIFIMIVLIWGIRAVLRKTTYTTANGQQYMNPDDEI